MKIIIDGNNLLFRASFAIPEFRNSDGVNIAAIAQSLKMIRSYAIGYDTKDVIVTWDQKLDYDPARPSFRSELNDNYKQNRRDNTAVYHTVSYIIEFLKYMGVPSIYPYRMEADDVIAWLCQKESGAITVISGDKDLLQLVNERVSVFNPYQKKTYTHLNFENEVGLPIEQFVLYKCILGDPSDNIKGLDRYGEKKSKKLAVEIGGFDNLSSVCDAHQIEVILTNRKIMDLGMGWSSEPDEMKSYEDQYAWLNTTQDPVKFVELANKLEMTKLANDSHYWLNPFTSKLSDVMAQWFS